MQNDVGFEPTPSCHPYFICPLDHSATLPSFHFKIDKTISLYHCKLTHWLLKLKIAMCITFGWTPTACNQAVIGRIYLQCSENHQKRPGSEMVNYFAISLLFLKSVGANPMNKQNFLKNRGCKCTHCTHTNEYLGN